MDGWLPAVKRGRIMHEKAKVASDFMGNQGVDRQQPQGSGMQVSIAGYFL